MPEPLEHGSLAEAADAIHWVTDGMSRRPYATQYQLYTQEMVESAIHPGALFEASVHRMRTKVNEFVTDQDLTVTSKAALALIWVQPIGEQPPSQREPSDD